MSMLTFENKTMPAKQ